MGKYLILSNDKYIVPEDNVDSIVNYVKNEDQVYYYDESNKIAGVIYNSLEQSDPKAINTIEDFDISKFYNFVLVNHNEENENEDGTVNYEILKRNNIFKFKNNNEYAKTVSITQNEMDSCCSDSLLSHQFTLTVGNYSSIVKNSGSKYNPESIVSSINTAYSNWRSAGKPSDLGENMAKYTDEIKLHDDTSDSYISHIVMPWETVSQDMSVYIANTKTLYLVDHIQGDSGKVYTFISKQPVTIDGVGEDISDWKLDPTGLSPSRIFTINSTAVGGASRTVTRCHYTTRLGASNCYGRMGDCGVRVFYNNGTYPRSGDLQQINLMGWARNNNKIATNSYPYAEGGYHALNTYISSLEIEYGTKYLHNPSLFGSGISSNDAANESTWETKNGIRYKLSTASSWTYTNWNSTSFLKNSGGAAPSTNHNSYAFNSEAAKEKCMESQMAASWAETFGIESDNKFTTIYGGTYWFKNANGDEGSLNKNMAVKIFKSLKFDQDSYNSSGEKVIYNIEVVLMISLFNGVQISGDIFGYCGGGAEHVATVTTNEQLNRTDNNIPCKVYIEPDQRKWLRESSSYKDNLEEFDFENSYKYMGEFITDFDGFVKDRVSYTGKRKTKGGAVNTYMCSYNWSYNYFNNSTLNRRTRLALRFFGSAYYVACSPRTLRSYHAVSYAHWYSGGFAQVLLRSS